MCGPDDLAKTHAIAEHRDHILCWQPGTQCSRGYGPEETSDSDRLRARRADHVSCNVSAALKAHTRLELLANPQTSSMRIETTHSNTAIPAIYIRTQASRANPSRSLLCSPTQPNESAPTPRWNVDECEHKAPFPRPYFIRTPKASMHEPEGVRTHLTTRTPFTHLETIRKSVSRQPSKCS